MNNRIDWGDGSFEFVTKQDLDKISIKQYRSAYPFTMCKYCVDNNCVSHKAVAKNVATKVVNDCLGKSLEDEEVVLSKLKDIAVEFKKTLDKGACICAFIQLLHFIDENTIIDVTDEVTKRLYVAFTNEIA